MLMFDSCSCCVIPAHRVQTEQGCSWCWWTDRSKVRCARTDPAASVWGETCGAKETSHCDRQNSVRQRAAWKCEFTCKTRWKTDKWCRTPGTPCRAACRCFPSTWTAAWRSQQTSHWPPQDCRKLSWLDTKSLKKKNHVNKHLNIL